MREFFASARKGGYTGTVTSKKGVIGCESPLARGAEPHPARFAAFSVLATSFGGPDGEAHASPVTLRVPRSLTPIRAAAQCESWSAVVHQAQLEINMAKLHAVSRIRATTHHTFIGIHECAALADAVDAKIASISENFGHLHPELAAQLSMLTCLTGILVSKVDGTCEKIGQLPFNEAEA